MRAVQKLNTDPKSVGCYDIPEIGAPADNEVKIKIAFSGICGSDKTIVRDVAQAGAKPQPMPLTLGHEFSGTIVEVGKYVTEFKAGDNVTAQPIVNICGHCVGCVRYGYAGCGDRTSMGYEGQGASTEFVNLNQGVVYKLPDNVSLEEGALTEPCCVAAHAVFDQTHVLPSDFVVVIGDGTIGLLVAAFAKSCGATVLLFGREATKARLAVGKELGLDYTLATDNIDPIAEARKLNGGRPADHVFECAGSEQTINQAIMMTKPKGTMIELSIVNPKGVNLQAMLYSVMTSMRIQNCFGHTPTNWLKTIQMLGDKKINVKPLITHKYKYEDCLEAFDTAFNLDGIKILLHP